MNIAIILAGGVGSRMRSDGFPKQYLEINKKPILVYTLEKFQKCPKVDKIVVVAHEQWKDSILSWADTYGIGKLSAIAPQGETRQESVLNGLTACGELSLSQKDVALIHDAARPLVTPELISACIEGLEGYDACLPVIPVKDTMYYSPDGTAVAGLTDRATLFCGQSPEVFWLLPYLQLNRSVDAQTLKQVRGCCELAFQKGQKVRMIAGEEHNFKLTTAEDMDRLCNLLTAEK